MFRLGLWKILVYDPTRSEANWPSDGSVQHARPLQSRGHGYDACRDGKTRGAIRQEAKRTGRRTGRSSTSTRCRAAETDATLAWMALTVRVRLSLYHVPVGLERDPLPL